MKKIILFLFVLTLTLSANAQFYFQGTIGLTTLSVKYDDKFGKKTESTTSFAISPGLGYQFNPKFAIGADLGFASSKDIEDSSTQWMFSPYARLICGGQQRLVNFYIDGVYEHSVFSQDKENITTNAFAIRPGLNIKLNEKCSLTTQMYLFSYAVGEEDVTATSFAFNPTSVSLGLKCFF